MITFVFCDKKNLSSLHSKITRYYIKKVHSVNLMELAYPNFDMLTNAIVVVAWLKDLRRSMMSIEFACIV